MEILPKPKKVYDVRGVSCGVNNEIPHQGLKEHLIIASSLSVCTSNSSRLL